MGKILKIFRYIYYKLVPQFVRIKFYKLELIISYYFNPLSKAKINRFAVEESFQACKKELSENDINSKYKYHLHRAFNKYQIRSQIVNDKWWSSFIYLTTLSEGEKFEKINKSLIKQIESSNFNSLEHYEVLHFYSLSLKFGFFELGYCLRKKSLNIALSYSNITKKSDSWKLKAKLSALLETKNFLEFDNLFSKSEKKLVKEKEHFNLLRNLLINKEKQLILNQNIINNVKKDQEFRKFIENKKITIVSPSPSENEDGYEIDKADVVIRTNNRMQNSESDYGFKGSRCDITYINEGRAKQIFEKGVSHWPKDNSWIVGKVRGIPDLVLKKLSSEGIETKSLNGRTLMRIDHVLFNGSLNFLPNIIIDILRHKPKEISLYHFDMMLTKERVSGYISKSREGGKSIRDLINFNLKSFAGHDPVTSFMFLKTLWKKDLIKVDKYFERVIKMEVKEYMKNLEKNYRPSSDYKIN